MNTSKLWIVLLIVIGFAGTALADPVAVLTEPSTLQDDWIVEGDVEELSTAAWNPGQLIASQFVTNTTFQPCPTDFDPTNQNPNVVVAITNRTGRFFTELYYVGDVHDDGSLETTFTNIDEFVADVTTGQTPVPGLAFKIDNVGLNQPLISESLNANLVFEPNETWEFVIQQYGNVFGLSPAAMGSVGPAPFGAIAQASQLDSVSSGSIITPEPATLTLLGLGGLLMLRRRR